MRERGERKRERWRRERERENLSTPGLPIVGEGQSREAGEWFSRMGGRGSNIQALPSYFARKISRELGGSWSSQN